MKEFIKYEDLQNEISRLADDVDRYVNLRYDKESMLMALQMVSCWAQEETIESTDNIDNTDNADGSSAPTPELKTPRTKKELEDALGTVNESGKWTPPAGSHIDPKTGNILNKDGVVVGTTQEPYSKARPGSQG